MVPKTISLSLLILALLSLCTSSDADPRPDPLPPFFFEALPLYGLPNGLFPDSVNYTLHHDGSFELLMERPCYLTFEYTVYYDKKISGKLSQGSITNLKGVLVQAFYFLWLDVDEVKVDAAAPDMIEFTIGYISVGVDILTFYTIRPCKSSPSLNPLLQLSGAV